MHAARADLGFTLIGVVVAYGILLVELGEDL